VLSGRTRTAQELSTIAAGAIEQSGDGGRRPVAGVLINRCQGEEGAAAIARQASQFADDGGIPVPVLSAVPTMEHSLARRVIDIVNGLDLRVLRRGEADTSRVANVLIAARSPEKLLAHLRPVTVGRHAVGPG
jgi:phosphate acetyltransferase